MLCPWKSTNKNRQPKVIISKIIYFRIHLILNIYFSYFSQLTKICERIWTTRQTIFNSELERGKNVSLYFYLTSSRKPYFLYYLYYLLNACFMKFECSYKTVLNVVRVFEVLLILKEQEVSFFVNKYSMKSAKLATLLIISSLNEI